MRSPRRSIVVPLAVVAMLGGGALWAAAVSGRTFGRPLSGATAGPAPVLTAPATTATRPTSGTQGPTAPYPVHHVSATTFWVGEPGDSDNQGISNTESIWDVAWQAHYGGVDDPNHRKGWLPAGFTPKENPFYFALPYSDLDGNADVKPSAAQVPWSATTVRVPGESIVKNTWVRITNAAGVTVYAQWEDAGPFGEDDTAYVFGTAAPINTVNDHAGIDLSPAAEQYLRGTGIDPVTWQFVPAADVPPGPWTQIVTTDGVDQP